jgi:hypothetical protein
MPKGSAAAYGERPMISFMFRLLGYVMLQPDLFKPRREVFPHGDFGHVSVPLQ